jgi:hypothetical protein
MRHRVHATTIPMSEPRPQEQVETLERDHARTAGHEGSRRDKQQAAEKHYGDNHVGGVYLNSAASTSRHEVRDGNEGQHMGARTTI